jgi:putative intracellular protease/amidase
MRATGPGKVLVALTASGAQQLQDGTERATGFFLNEFYEPYAALRGGGYEVVVVTPEGKPPVVDPESLKEKYWSGGARQLQAARRFAAVAPMMKSPRPLTEALERADDYQALLVPGGQGLMNDLIQNPELLALVERFGESERPVGLVCHAPALLENLGARSALRGRLVTSVSGGEEWFIETFIMGGKPRVRNIGDRLEAAGFVHAAAFPGSSHAVRDCNLVTSQNPYSGDDFNRLFLAALHDWRRGARCVPVGP